MMFPQRYSADALKESLVYLARKYRKFHKLLFVGFAVFILKSLTEPPIN
jgi:hypothetical protein